MVSKFDVIFLKHVILTNRAFPSSRFQALDCVTISERRYVKVDTSLDCDSFESQTFIILDGLFIVIYLGIPLLWLLLLCRRQADLNPSTLDLRLKYYLRDRQAALNPIRFLFDVYRPQLYFFEVVEMYVDHPASCSEGS